MAIIQISKIQQRSGNLVDLPQLDEAQLGWANDAKRLFIGGTGNANTDNENIEVLTAYSNITYSQIEGSYGNLNINIANSNVAANSIGQVLAFDGNNWINAGGNAGGRINLGDVANLKIGGAGGIGYVLQTDGLGNLSWTPKGTLYTNIIGLSNATPIVMTVANTVPYTNQQSITISGVNGASNTIVNGLSFYVKLSSNYPVTGNITLYSDASLTVPINGTGLTYTNSPNAIATALIGGGSGVGAPGGSNSCVQFNEVGTFGGNAGFTFNSITGALAVPGNISTSNASLGNSVTANYFIGNFYGTSNLATYATTANAVAAANVSGLGNIATINLTGSTTNVLYGNGVFAAPAGGYGDSNVATFLASYGSNTISTTGNISGGNIIGTGSTSITGNLNINTGTPTYEDPNGSIITGRMLGRYVNRVGNANYYFVDYNANNTVTSSDTLLVAKLGSILDTTIGNSNISMAIGTNYGSKTAGLAFISGTANDVTKIAVGIPTSYTDNVNAVMLGYPTVGPRILVQDYALLDDSPNVITYIATTHSFVGDISSGNITLANNSTISAGSNTNVGTITGNWTLSSGSTLQATYADLAEYYIADKHYEPGTVLAFGGDKEVTIAEDATARVAGIVSTNPAYVLNTACEGEHTVVLALQGRVPCKVRGNIKKGDMLISAGNGFARPALVPSIGTVIGKSLENFDGIEGIIEVAVGRL